MTGLLDAFWRAVAYCMHPRVVALSFLPLLAAVALSLGLGYLYWDAALDLVRGWLESSSVMAMVGEWMQSMRLGSLRTVVAPLIVIFAVTPAIVLVSLMAVAILMTPSLVDLVAERRFPRLERRQGGSMLASVLWSAGSLLLAAVAMVASMPLWLIPPLVMVLPPLIWGWLTYRVMAFDALAAHASREERREIFRRHRMRLLGIGILTGYLGAAPSIVWASGALFAAAFVILVPVAIWIYTLVFAFSSLWFAHYCLGALERLRAEAAAPLSPVVAAGSRAVAVPLALGDERTPPA